MKTILIRAFIVSFCIWHMTAVAVYGMPSILADHITQERNSLMQRMRPYMQMTSQWQKWNLFAPDPLRRVSEYLVEVQQNRRWILRGALRPEKVEWWRRAHELKLARRMEDSAQPLRVRWAHLFCDQYHIAPQTPIRIVRHYYVVPRSLTYQSVLWWQTYDPAWRTDTLVRTVCPPSSP